MTVAGSKPIRRSEVNPRDDPVLRLRRCRAKLLESLQRRLLRLLERGVEDGEVLAVLTCDQRLDLGREAQRAVCRPRNPGSSEKQPNQDHADFWPNSAPLPPRGRHCRIHSHHTPGQTRPPHQTCRCRARCMRLARADDATASDVRRSSCRSDMPAHALPSTRRPGPRHGNQAPISHHRPEVSASPACPMAALRECLMEC
jgi:hypothetical protein